MADRAAPYVLGPEESRRSVTYPGGRALVRAGKADAAGKVSVIEIVADKGGPPVHVHDNHDEMCLVLSGTLLVQLDDERSELAAGGFAWIPLGVALSFANPSDEPVRALSIHVPGGFEGLLEEQAEYAETLSAGSAPDMAKLAVIAAKYDTRPTGPRMLSE